MLCRVGLYSRGKNGRMLKVDNLETAKKEGRAPWTDVVYDFKDMVWYNDGFPVTEGHSLIVPKEATQERIIKCMELAMKIGNDNVAKGIIDGYNIGINVGKAAGQTVMYPHVHLIPRKKGDCENPKGGVRHVIPGKGDYTKNE